MRYSDRNEIIWKSGHAPEKTRKIRQEYSRGYMIDLIAKVHADANVYFEQDH